MTSKNGAQAPRREDDPEQVGRAAVVSEGNVVTTSHQDTADPSFASLVRRLRRHAGLTQEELAERADISIRAVSDLERGLKRRPHSYTVQRLADALRLEGEDRAAFARVARGPQTLPRAESHVSPLPTVPVAAPGRLPVQATPFLGRESETAAALEILSRPEVRLLTLTGTGGTGKTRLALHLAARVQRRYRDGVYFVPLGSLSDPRLMVSAIATSLGIQEERGQSFLETLVEHLDSRQLLLLLDNFEHLLDTALTVARLLQACPALTILVTSRVALHVASEHEYVVPPLSMPDMAHLPPLEILERSDAVALFVSRAQAVRPAFVLTRDTAPVVAEICHRLDGLPLAIELAATWIRIFPPRSLLRRLSRRLPLLVGGAHDAPARQRTMRASLDWEYALLSPEERRLFARLSVFVGGGYLEAIEAVCGWDHDQTTDVLTGVASLVKKSLLIQKEGVGGEPRFAMLETIREYATEKLEERGEVQEMQRRHAVYFLQFAERIRPLLDGPGQVDGLNLLDEERANGRAVMDWACEQGELEIGLRMAIAAEYLSLYLRGYGAEAWGWFERLLARIWEEGQTMKVEAAVASALLEGAGVFRIAC